MVMSATPDDGSKSQEAAETSLGTAREAPAAQKPLGYRIRRECSSLWCLLRTVRSDPIMAIWASDSFCLIGTLLGRVSGFLFNGPLTAVENGTGEIKSPSIARRQVSKGRSSRGLTSCFFFSSKTRKSQNKTLTVRAEPYKVDDITGPNTTTSRDIIPTTSLGVSYLLSAYSEDGVRAVYADSKTAYAIIGNSICRTWALDDFTNQSHTTLDYRLNTTHKHVLSHESKVLIVSMGVTVIVDMETQELINCPFRLMDKDIVPCSFNGTHLAIYAHHPDDIPHIKIMKLPSSPDDDDVRRKYSLECVFSHNLPNAKIVTIVRLWRENYLVFTTQGKDIHVIDWIACRLKFKLLGHTDDVIAVDVSDKRRLLSLSRKRELKIWDGDSGRELLTIRLQGEDILFENGIPNIITSLGRWVFFSADQGLFLLDLGSEFI